MTVVIGGKGGSLCLTVDELSNVKCICLGPFYSDSEQYTNAKQFIDGNECSQFISCPGATVTISAE